MLVTKLGAVKDNRDHRVFVVQVTDRIKIRTKVSHGSGYKTIGSQLVSDMARQCRVTTGEFTELVTCTLSREQWVERVKKHPDTPQ